MGEDTTVGACDSAGVGVHALEDGGASNLDTSHFGSEGVLGEVLNAEFATGGLYLTELVSLGSV